VFSAAAVTAAVGEIGWLFGGWWVLGGRVAGQFLKLVAMGRTTKWAAATPLGPVACAFFMHPHIHSCWAGFLRFYFFFFLVKHHHTLNRAPSGVGACRILWLLIGFFGRSS